MILYHLIQQLYSLSFLNFLLLCKLVFANFMQCNAFWLHSLYTLNLPCFRQVSSPHLGLLPNLVSSEFYLGHLGGRGFRGIYWSTVSLTLKIITHIHLYIVSICYLCMECKVLLYLSLMRVWLPKAQLCSLPVQATIASEKIWLKWQDHAEKLTFSSSSPSFPYVILFLLPLTSLDP